MNSAKDVFCLGLFLWTAPASAAVLAFGSHYGMEDLPAGLSNIIQISSWDINCMALDRGGNVTIWGFTGDRFSWAQRVGALSNAVLVATGLAHDAVLKSDGTIIAWGDTGAACGFAQPSAMPVSLSLGRSYTLGLTADGKILVCGENQWDTVTLPEGLTHARSVAAAYAFAVAVTLDGTIEVWGEDAWYGDIYNIKAVPLDAVRVKSVVAGLGHALALREDGTVIAWGLNDFGQATVPAGLRDVVAVSAGHWHSLALLKNGTVVGWGDSSHGETDISASRVTSICAAQSISFVLTRDPPRLGIDLDLLWLEGEPGQGYALECWEPGGWRQLLAITNLPATPYLILDNRIQSDRFYRAVELEP